jgi:glycosyltransferase involved in cell wall biosynthesis
VRLLIISHTEHYQSNGRVYGWGPTVREIDHVASLFEQVTHLAFLYPGQPPPSSLPYQAANVSFVPVPASGGEDLLSKLGILLRLPRYLWKISRELGKADVVHVRCPAGISLLAIVLLALRRTPRLRWIKYAGNWQPEGKDALSYRFQRWWLQRGLAKAVVTVNGNWPSQPEYIHSFLNPCLTEQERQHAETLIHQKESSRFHMIFAGRVERAKGIQIALDVLTRLHQDDIPATLDVVGDGPGRPFLEHSVAERGLGEAVRFHGWVPRTEMGRLYANAHLILLPTASEGWPKVLSEAMAYGVVPVASDVSSIGQNLRQFGVGCAVTPVEVDGFVKAVKVYICDAKKWKQESAGSIAAAGHFTYEAYLQTVRNLLGLPAL